MPVDSLLASRADEQVDVFETELLAVSFERESVDEQVSVSDDDAQTVADASDHGGSDTDEPGTTAGANEGVSEFDGFVGESLEVAWSEALAVDQSLEATRWNTSAIQRGLFAAKSEYLPSVSARSTYNAMDQELALKNPLPIPGTPAEFQFSNREFVTAGVTVTQPSLTITPLCVQLLLTDTVFSNLERSGATTSSKTIRARSSLRKASVWNADADVREGSSTVAVGLDADTHMIFL